MCVFGGLNAVGLKAEYPTHTSAFVFTTSLSRRQQGGWFALWECCDHEVDAADQRVGPWLTAMMIRGSAWLSDPPGSNHKKTLLNHVFFGDLYSFRPTESLPSVSWCPEPSVVIHPTRIDWFCMCAEGHLDQRLWLSLFLHDSIYCRSLQIFLSNDSESQFVWDADRAIQAHSHPKLFHSVWNIQTSVSSSKTGEQKGNRWIKS